MATDVSREVSHRQRTRWRQSEPYATICGKCGVNPRLKYHAYCKDCRNAYMRANRDAPEGLAKARANARSYANVYVKRGRLKKEPCHVCGEPKSQMHHADYSKPLEVVWLCRKHHLDLHALHPHG